MPVNTSTYNLLDPVARTSLAAAAPERLHDRPEGAAYLDLRGLPLEPLPDIDEARIAGLCRVVRGLVFAAVDGAQSGHPGGSSSKTEQLVTLLASGALGFDAWQPKHAGRDRIVWSAGHCSPLSHALGALVYETLRRKGVTLTGADAETAVYPEDLARFRKWGGPSGHVESTYALADTSTGSSGHGFSAALGFAVLHRSCGLPTKAFAIAGDAETEEGMSYEARNVAARLGAPQPGGDAGLQHLRHRRIDLRSDAGAVFEPLAGVRLERHRGGRACHPRAGLCLSAGRRGVRGGAADGGDLPYHQGTGLRQAGKHRRFARHAARPRRVCRGDADAGLRHSGRQGRGGGRSRAWWWTA